MKGKIEFEWYKGRWEFTCIVTYLPAANFDLGLSVTTGSAGLDFVVAGLGFHVSAFRYPSFK